MRIVFTTMIAPVISQADVSHNGLFIGLWTEAEVSLGFIVACSLCLPKLIQAKGKKLKRAMSKASSPFSTMRSTVRSVSRRSTFTLRSGSRKSTQATSRGSIQLNDLEPKQAAYCEERELEQQPQPQPTKHTPDPYALPTTTGSSEYSQSIDSKRHSDEDNSIRLAPLHVPRTSSSDLYSSVRSPAHRMTRDQMTPEQLRDEINMLQQFNFGSRRPSVEE